MTMDVPYTIRPIDTWPGETTRDRKPSQFRASNSDTLAKLADELRHLHAKNVVLLMAVQEKDIRLDGQLRANARPSHPGVVLAFDSKHGPLKYSVDRYTNAWDNIRGIALGLSALRAVDRYGVTRRGEQYTGWKQLGSGTPMPTAMTLQEAAEFIVRHSVDNKWSDKTVAVTDDRLISAGNWRVPYRHAAHALHPDRGGSTEDFQRLQEAKQLLEAHHG